ncbi:glycosyltransferase family 4 protein [Planctomycetota bacterium]
MTSPTGVLYVHHASRLGGAEQSLVDLIAGIDRTVVRPVVILPEEGPLATRIRALGADVRLTRMKRLTRTVNPMRLIGYAADVLLGARAIAGIAAELDASWIHANSVYAAFHTARAARLAGIGSACHLRDMVSLPFSAGSVLSRFDVVIPISEAVAGFYGLDPNTVIPSGIDFDRFDTSASGTALREQVGIPPETPVAGMVSQLVPWKNHRDFLRAAAAILKKLPEVHFLMVGSDSFGDHPAYQNDLEQFAVELGIAESVHWLGWHEHMSEVYAAIDVLIHPTAVEPFGRVLVEAMGCGVPVVACDAAGPSEIVTNETTGFLVPAGDTDALASKGCALLADEALRSRMRAAAGDDVRSRFSAAVVSRRVMDLYRRSDSPAK